MALAICSVSAPLSADIYAVRVTDMDDPAPLRAVLSTDECAKYDRLKRAVDQQRFLVGRYSLRKLLADRLEVSPKHIRFQYSESGKPRLDGSWHFSLSHSGCWILIALHREFSVGVDIEAPRQLRNPVRLLRRFNGYSNELSDIQQAALVLWVRTEAMLKAAGCGIAGFNEFERIEDSYCWHHQVVRISDLTFTPDTSYSAALAVLHPASEESV